MSKVHKKIQDEKSIYPGCFFEEKPRCFQEYLISGKRHEIAKKAKKSIFDIFWNIFTHRFCRRSCHILYFHDKRIGVYGQKRPQNDTKNQNILIIKSHFVFSVSTFSSVRISRTFFSQHNYPTRVFVVQDKLAVRSKNAIMTPKKLNFQKSTD